MAGETVAIVDYGSGNLHSAEKAFQRVAAPLGQTVRVTDRAEDVAAADRIMLPGVGSFGDCARGLKAADGMVDALEQRVMRDGRPFLGVCVGAQLTATVGEERGSFDGLGWIPGRVVEVTPDDPLLKIPHMGWNALRLKGAHPIVEDLPAGGYAYFVHSYHVTPDDPAAVIADVTYGGAITAAVASGPVVGVQFHPEKSQAVGLRLIENFLRWRP